MNETSLTDVSEYFVIIITAGIYLFKYKYGQTRGERTKNIRLKMGGSSSLNSCCGLMLGKNSQAAGK
jgi:hypothetical protein